MRSFLVNYIFRSVLKSPVLVIKVIELFRIFSNTNIIGHSFKKVYIYIKVNINTLVCYFA